MFIVQVKDYENLKIVTKKYLFFLNSEDYLRN
jgi:hypothetical protein